jgi:hypothetical protein
LSIANVSLHHSLYLIGLFMERRRRLWWPIPAEESVCISGLEPTLTHSGFTAHVQAVPRGHHRHIARHHTRFTQISFPYIQTAYLYIAAAKFSCWHAGYSGAHPRIPERKVYV